MHDGGVLDASVVNKGMLKPRRSSEQYVQGEEVRMKLEFGRQSGRNKEQGSHCANAIESLANDIQSWRIGGVFSSLLSTGSTIAA